MPGLALGVLLASGCGPKSPAASREKSIPVTLETDWYPEAEHGGFYQALDRGFYRDVGLDVTIAPGGPNTHPIVELAVGHAQFAIAASDDVIEQAEQGLPFLIVGAFMERYPEAVLVHEESPVHSFKDLDGRTIIGVPGTGWISHVQQKYGIRINVVPVAFELTRFMGNKDTIQQVYLTNEPYFVKKNGVKARTLYISETGYDPYRVIITTHAFAKAHPDVVRDFVAASNKGWNDFIFGDASPGRKQVMDRNHEVAAEYFNASLDIMRKEHLIDGLADRHEHIGALSLARLQDEIDLLARIKFIRAAFPVERVATDAFLPPELRVKP